MNLYVVRHGTVPSNNANRIAGNNKEELTEVGIHESEEARNILKNIHFDVIFCSHVLRTIQTAEIINVHDVKIVFDEGVAEREVGSMKGKSRNEINWETWNSLEFDVTPEGAETLGAVLKRVKVFLDKIRKDYQGKNVLVVTHSLVCKCIWILENGVTDKEMMDQFIQKNGEIRKYILK